MIVETCENTLKIQKGDVVLQAECKRKECLLLSQENFLRLEKKYCYLLASVEKIVSNKDGNMSLLIYFIFPSC